MSRQLWLLPEGTWKCCKNVSAVSVCTRMKIRFLCAALPLVLAATQALTCHAEVRLASLFSDHAVFQCDKPVPVWGWATPGEDVTVKFAGQIKTTKAGTDGKWMTRLDPMPASDKTSTLQVSGSNTLVVEDVLVGEVWLGSGQSNMAMTVNRTKDYEIEKAGASFPHIRMFTVKATAAAQRQEDCEGTWVICTPDTVGAFSATAFFFGREVHRALKVPVGLINSSVGGTPIDSWIEASVQEASPELRPLVTQLQTAAQGYDPAAAQAQYERQLARWPDLAKQAKAAGRPIPRKPQDPAALRKRKGGMGGLYNGKIAPLEPYALRGFLWYQGEANTTPQKAPYYQHHLPLLVTDWRKKWGEELPFAWVQLPNFASRGEGWCLVREAMLKSLKLPRTGMAITIDVGEVKDIHPKNKQAVGQRLAAWALGTVYGRTNETSGPLLKSSEEKEGFIELTFTHADGLKAEGGELKEFVIAGEDRQWKPARATIVEGRVQVRSDVVPKPVAVRYAWVDDTSATLFNGAGLPASPFRTDDWPITFPEPVVRPRTRPDPARKQDTPARPPVPSTATPSVSR